MRIRVESGGRLVDEGPAGRVLCVQGRALVKDRKLERPALYMASYGSERGMLIVLDYADGVAEEYEFPEGVTAWNLIQARDGLVYIGGYGPGRLLAFDTLSRRYVPLPDTPGRIAGRESVICDLAEAPDGAIYLGTYPDCRLLRYRPGEDRIELVVQLAEDEMYARWVTALPDGRLVCFVGCHKSRLVIVDPVTGALQCLTPDWLQGPSNWGQPHLVGHYAVHLAQNPRTGSRVLAVYDWTAASFAGFLPWTGEHDPVIIGAGPDGGLLLGARGGAVEEWLLPSGSARPIWPGLLLPDLPGTSAYLDEQGRLVGQGGRDYWVGDSGSGRMAIQSLPAQGAYIAPLGLKALSNGEVWGSFHLGQSIFRVVGGGETAQTYGPVVDVGGEVYDLEEQDGSLLMASYVEAVLSRFDPRAPWRPGTGVDANPREFARIGDDQYRPCAGVAWAPDGRLAIGTMARYGIAGGAISFYDPVTGDLQVVRDPVPGQAITALDGDGTRLCAGTSIHSNGVSCADAWAHVFLWDAWQQQIVDECYLPNEETVSWVVLLPGERVLVSAGGRLYLWETEAGQITIVSEPGHIGINGCARAANGEVWMVLNGMLTLFNPRNGGELVQYEAGAGELSGPIAVASDGVVYARRRLGIASFRAPA